MNESPTTTEETDTTNNRSRNTTQNDGSSRGSLDDSDSTYMEEARDYGEAGSNDEGSDADPYNLDSSSSRCLWVASNGV